MSTLNMNDTITQKIVSSMQKIYAASSDAKAIYLLPFRMYENGYLFDEQSLLVDLVPNSANLQSVIDSILETDSILESQNIKTSIDIMTEEHNLKSLILIPKEI